jgi:hypothetical protein
MWFINLQQGHNIYRYVISKRILLFIIFVTGENILMGEGKKCKVVPVLN